MNQKSQTRQTGAAKAIKDIRRATRKQYSAEEKIRIVLDGFVARRPLPNFAVVKALPRASITNGRRSFWKLESAGLPAILPEQPLGAR